MTNLYSLDEDLEVFFDNIGVCDYNFKNEKVYLENRYDTYSCDYVEIENRHDRSFAKEIFIDLDGMCIEHLGDTNSPKTTCDECGTERYQEDLINITVETTQYFIDIKEMDLKDEYVDYDGMVCTKCFNSKLRNQIIV